MLRDPKNFQIQNPSTGKMEAFINSVGR